MEIVLCVFLGLWISAAGVFAYIWIKKEMSPYMKSGDSREEKAE